MGVFAPAPILTVTIEPGTENPEVHVHPGGQGAWVANMLAVLETHAALCAPLGGEIGMVLGTMLNSSWIDLRSVTVSGTNGCRVEDRRPGDLECLVEMRASTLDRHESDELCNQLLTVGLETAITVLTGSAGNPTIDPDIYRRVASDLKHLDVTVIADLSGDALGAALEGGVSILKVSDEELDAQDCVDAAKRLRDLVAEVVVLTRGSEPALVLADEIRAIEVPELETVNHRGAGDSMTAGIAAGLARGDSLDDALRLGAAAGAVNVTRHGLASGRRDTIEALAEQVTIRTATKEEVQRARTHHQ